MAGLAGWQGSIGLARRHWEELERRFCGGFLDPLLKAGDREGGSLELDPDPPSSLCSSGKLADWILAQAGRDICCVHPCGRGGIFTGIWDLAREADLGVRIYLDRIPIRQETIEVCDHLDVNPYLLTSGGMVLLVSDRPLYVRMQLAAAGLETAQIGYFTGDHDRLVIYDGKERFLEPFRGER